MSGNDKLQALFAKWDAEPEREKLALKLSDAGPEEDEAREWVQRVIDIETKPLRDKLALIEVTVALWEAEACELRNQTHEILNCDYVRADVLQAHAEVLRDILKGE